MQISNHTETSELIIQSTGFYMIATFAFNELIIVNIFKIFYITLCKRLYKAIHKTLSQDAVINLYVKSWNQLATLLEICSSKTFPCL